MAVKRARWTTEKLSRNSNRSWHKCVKRTSNLLKVYNQSTQNLAVEGTVVQKRRVMTIFATPQTLLFSPTNVACAFARRCTIPSSIVLQDVNFLLWTIGILNYLLYLFLRFGVGVHQRGSLDCRSCGRSTGQIETLMALRLKFDSKQPWRENNVTKEIQEKIWRN